APPRRRDGRRRDALRPRGQRRGGVGDRPADPRNDDPARDVRAGHLGSGGRLAPHGRGRRLALSGQRHGGIMKGTRRLHDAGQSIGLDNITRALLKSGGLRRYIDELSVTGLTSNPTIFDNAIRNGLDYDDAIRTGAHAGRGGEELFFELALEDLTGAADLFRSVHERTNRVDGWVSLELSPTLAYDTQRSVAAAKDLHARAGRPNLFIKIPGTPEGVPAIEEAIFAGGPIDVTLLFSPWP